MIWIIGLGNPGVEYEQTRHNVGFMVIDALAAQHNLNFSNMPKQQAVVAKNDQLCLVKPLTYMNESGVAARSVLQFFDKQVLAADPLDMVYVVHDDLDIQLGQWKCELAHGPRMHNGLLSLYEQLGTQQFWHVRVGIDGAHRQAEGGRIPGRAYVLQRFASDELPLLDDTISAILKTLETKLSI